VKIKKCKSLIIKC